MRTRGLLVLVQLCLTGALAAQQTPPSPPPAPKIALGATGATVSSVTPNGKVAWMAVAREIEDMSLRLVRKADLIADEDGDGAVKVAFERAVPPQSVWIAVDLTTGGFAIAAPAGFPLNAVELPLSALRPGAVRNADVLDLSHRMLELLLVRPNRGAWIGTFGDGGPDDVDGTGDGRLQVALDSLEPLGDSGPMPVAVVRPDDVIVAVDSTSLDLYAARVTVPR